MLVAIAATLRAAPASSAQQPGVPVAPPPPYRTPALILAQPADGGTVPADRPVVVFRFAPGEMTDPIDALSFVVAVDGVNRTERFQITSGEAWGPIDDPSLASATSHDVRARICSVRGTCSVVRGVVSTTPTDALLRSTPRITAAASKAAPIQRARSTVRVLDKVLQAATVLSRP